MQTLSVLPACKAIPKNRQKMFLTIKPKQKRVLISILLTLASFLLRAQVIQTGKMETPIKLDLETYSVVSLDTSGIMLYRSFIGDKEDQLELTRLDTSLLQIWKGFVPVPKEFRLVDAKVNSGKVFFFFKNQNPSDVGFYVKAVRVTDGASFSYPIKNPIQFNATEFIVSNDALLIGGYFNFKPIVLHYLIKENRSRVLPGFLNERGELIQIKTYPDGDIDVIVSAENNKGIQCLWLRHFDSSGDLIKTVVLEPEEHKNLVFGQLVKMDNNIQVIAGTYGRNADYCLGIFVAEINHYGEYLIRYHDFADLQNFFYYMKTKREKKIKARIEKTHIKGKRIKLNYQFLVHELIPCGNQFIVLGEAFYPAYNGHSNFYGNPSFYSPWSYRNPNHRQSNLCLSNFIFNRFLNTHPVMIGFDAHANLLWVNCFGENGFKNPNSEQLIKTLSLQNDMAPLYLYENAIRCMIIKGQRISEVTKNRHLKNGVHSSKLEYWYTNHLFAYGIQDVNDNNDNSHKIFFINKLSAH
jgi:hypothetical protein